MSSLNSTVKSIASCGIVIAGLLISAVLPYEASANVPIMRGKVVTESGVGVAYIHVKWEDASGGVRFAKTDSAGYYVFPSWSDYVGDPNYVPVPIPWNVAESGDETKRLIDIWKTNSFKQEFTFYMPRVVNGVSFPQSSWSCLSNPNKFSVVVADTYDCEQVIVEPAHRGDGTCDSIYFDKSPYQKSEVCQLDFIVNQREYRSLPNFVCKPPVTTKVSGTVMCVNPADGKRYPVDEGTVDVGGKIVPVRDGAYSADGITRGQMIAARLSLPEYFLIDVDGKPTTIQADATQIFSVNGCNTSFMNTNCGGIRPERAVQCDDHNNVTGSYEWCTLPTGSSALSGFDFLVNNCVIPTTPPITPPITPPVVSCVMGQVNSVASAINFKMNPAGTYDLITVTWKQVETTVNTDFFDLRFIPANSDETPSATGASVGPVRFARGDVDTATAGNYSAILTEQSVRDIHQMLISESKSKLIIEVTPIEIGGATCPPATGIAQKGTSIPINTTTDILVKVRDGECVGDALPATPGSLSAAWPGGSSGSPTTAAQVVVTIPTGSTLTTTYTFTDDLYACKPCGTTVDQSTADLKKCQRTGYSDMLESVIYIAQQNITSWWEVLGGLAYGRTLTVNLPLDFANNPAVCYTSPGVPDQKCAPYLSRSSNFTQNLLAGIPMAGTLNVESGWSAERPRTAESAQSLPLAHNNALKKSSGFVYNYFLSLIPSDLRTSFSNPTVRSLSELPSTGSRPKYFITTGSLTIDPDSPIVVGAAEKYIIFVGGSLTIGNDTFDPGSLRELIKVEEGGFLAVIVKGEIVIKRSVGTAMNADDPSAADGVGQNIAATVGNIAGIYVADGVLTIDGNGSAVIPDKRFIGDGSFVSASGILMRRSYSRDVLPLSKILAGYTPTEVFRHRPDIVLATPKELKQYTMQYQEIQ